MKVLVARRFRVVGVVLASVMALSAVMPSTAAASSLKMADTFAANNQAGVNFVPAATTAFNDLKAMGYTTYMDGRTSPGQANMTAALAMSYAYAQTDTVWANFGHGMPGGQAFYSTAIGGNGVSYVLASPAEGSCSGNNACLTNYYVPGIKLMLFAGCQTAATDYYTGVNLVANAVRVGAKTAVGFPTDSYQATLERWTYTFFSALQRGNTVQSSVWVANAYMKSIGTPATDGTTAAVFVGNTGTVIYPAS